MADRKTSYTVIKFIMEAVRFNKTAARHLLAEIPRECHARLYMQAMRWDSDIKRQAAAALSEVLGTHSPDLLTDAIAIAEVSSTEADRIKREQNGDHDEDGGPRRKRRARRHRGAA